VLVGARVMMGAAFDGSAVEERPDTCHRGAAPAEFLHLKVSWVP
jgi:hypothetical protein